MKKLLLILTIIIAFASCKGGNSTNPPCTSNCPPVGGTGDGTGKVFALNTAANSLLRFDGFSDLTGNLTPESTVQGALTTMSSPQYMFYDSTHDDMYVSNAGNNSILVYHAPSAADGNVAPDRTISSSGVIVGPKGVAVDVTNDRLYVTKSNDTILVFSGASALDTTSATTAAVISSNTAFNTVDGIYFDSSNDRLFVTNTGTNSVQVFDGVSSWSGTSTISPDRIIVGGSTGLNQPVQVQVVGTELVVSNKAGNSVTVYSNASSVNGNALPVRTLSGSSTTLSSPKQTFYDSTNDELWVANSGAGSILIFKDFSTATGNVAPDRTISGTDTGFSGSNTVSGIFVLTSD